MSAIHLASSTIFWSTALFFCYRLCFLINDIFYMAIWLVRAGAKGEHQQRFLDDSRIYLTKRLLNFDVSDLAERAELITLMSELYVDDKPRKVSNLASQVWAFGQIMQVGDLVVLPCKFKPVVYVGVIASAYQFNEAIDGPYNHWRQVHWSAQPIARASFSKELLSSFSAAMTICQIKREGGEQTLQQMFNDASV